MSKIQFKKFPMGFWNCYNYGIDGMTEKEIADMAACGMTLTMSPETSHELKVETLRALDLCEKYGIQLILSDKRSHWTNIRKGEDVYRAGMREAYEDFGKHPAVFGFYIGDEPSADQIDDSAKAYSIALEEGPGLVPYLNMLPDNIGNCRKFINNSGCNLLSYDRYTQMLPESWGVSGFVGDMVSYKKLADEMDVSLLSIMLSTGHYCYRVPSYDDLRWQLGVALACGSNAVFWFTYYTPARYNNYRLGPITEFGVKTPVYYSLQDIQLYFNKYYSEIFNHSDFRAVNYIVKEYPPIEPFRNYASPFAEKAHVLDVFSEIATPGLVTFLDGRDMYEGKHYVMVTNNTWDKTDLFHVTFPKDVKHIYRVYANEEVDFLAEHSDARVEPGEDHIDCCVYLAPGQFNIFRAE